MGPSGSGKTTLLDLLAGRKTVGTTEGHVSFGGVKPTKQFLRRYTGYVEQVGVRGRPAAWWFWVFHSLLAAASALCCSPALLGLS